MSRFGIALGIVVLACWQSVACQASNNAGIRWAPDVESARKAAAQFKVPVLIHFYGDNCVPCKTLEQRVFTQQELVDTLNKYFICVRVNGTRDRQTAAQYQVHSWPTDVFLSPDGKTLYQGICPQDLRGYMSTLQNVAVMNRDRNLMLAAETASQSSSSQVNNYTAATPGNAALASAQATVQSSMYASSATSQTAATPAAQATSPQNLPGPTNQQAGSFMPVSTRVPSTATPQLGPANPPAKNVNSGPLTAENQPSSVTSASKVTGVSNTPIPVSNNRNPGQLPDRNLVGQVAPPVVSASNQNLASPANYGSMPSVDSASQVGAAVLATPKQSMASTASAHTLDNPYFNNKPQQATELTVQANSAESANRTVDARLASHTLNRNAAATESSTSSSMPTFQPQLRSQESASSLTEATTATKASATQATSETADPPASTEHLGLEGYCPVTLKEEGQWQEGKPEFAVQHRGCVYWMCSQEAMQKFLAAPDETSPVLSGYDPLLLLEEGKLVEGKIHFGLQQFNGTYLLFASAESKQKYWDNFDRYSKALNALISKLHE